VWDLRWVLHTFSWYQIPLQFEFTRLRLPVCEPVSTYFQVIHHPAFLTYSMKNNGNMGGCLETPYRERIYIYIYIYIYVYITEKIAAVCQSLFVGSCLGVLVFAWISLTFPTELHSRCSSVFDYWWCNVYLAILENMWTIRGTGTNDESPEGLH